MPELEQVVQTMAEYNLALPCLLFVVSHRPCAFLTGQLLYVVAPLAALLGFSACQEWAALLSQPEGVLWLEQALTNVAEKSGATKRTFEEKKGQP
ncbi:MAG: hypothetical protein U0350_13165 [Caldilineaceae bacterium]